MKILRRNLSLMLALRYLNPLRSMFSIITMICLMGVALGVMVLIVVLSVMEGMQKEVEDRVLAFTPHYVLSSSNGLGQRSSISENDIKWVELTEKIQNLPGIKSAYPIVENEGIVQSAHARKTCRFTAVDVENKKQLEPLAGMLKEGSFDFGSGLDQICVISHAAAKSLGLQVGDMLHLTPVGSIDEIAEIYSMIQNPLPTHANKQFISDIQALFAKADPAAALVQPDAEAIKRIYDAITNFDARKMRSSEQVATSELINIIYDQEDAGNIGYTPEQRELWQKTASDLAALDRDREDGKAVKNINEMIMPIDLEVIGIYRSPGMLPSPDIFMPLTIAQDIMGYSVGGSNQIQGIGVRINSAHETDAIASKLADIMPQQSINPENPHSIYWNITPWTKSLERWYRLIANERTLMSFVLSIISLIASFCIMAVMFTMSIQRRREIAVMQALGATPWAITRIFIWQGIIIGFSGAILGVVLSLLVLYFRIEIQSAFAAVGLDPFPMEAHGITLPAVYKPIIFIKQALIAFFMVAIAAVIPAIFISRQDPSKALRTN